MFKYIKIIKEKLKYEKILIPILAIVIVISVASFIILNFYPSISDKIPSIYKPAINVVLTTFATKPFWIIVELQIKKTSIKFS